jgi:C-terminal processing protease CtpA/Prc
MLRELRDLHIWLKVGKEHVPVFNRPRRANANPHAYRSILGALRSAGPGLCWGITANHIGFITISQWRGKQLPNYFDRVLEQMRHTRGLILDVRLNGGGSEPLAKRVAARFLDREVVYAYSQYRNGPKHTDLTDTKPRKARPRGPWRYDRPVVLLIGNRCMSSNESFIAMMTTAPQVVTMGDRTCGSSGNPKLVRLPLGITVSVPQWIDYLPDGMPLDERGIEPEVPFVGTANAFQGERDELVTAALQRLRKVPLPARAIING